MLIMLVCLKESSFRKKAVKNFLQEEESYEMLSDFLQEEVGN